MDIRIVDPVVVEKVGRLARKTGLSETAAIERAVDTLLIQPTNGEPRQAPRHPTEADWQRMRELLGEMDRIPDLPDARDPLEWDENGLPI